MGIKRSKMTTAIHHFKKGDRVTVLNTDLHGKLRIEGTATITRLLKGEDRYNVVFNHPEAKHQGLTRQRFERYIDPNAQADLEAWCDTI